MWKSLTAVLVVVLCLFMWFSPAGGQEVNDRNLPDLPSRDARDFVPWITAIIQQRTDIAQRLFPFKRHAQETVQSPHALRILRKFPKLTGMEISLIGGRTLGSEIGTLLFTVATEDGPVAFKIYHYKFAGQRYVSSIEITDNWSEIERLYLTVDILQNPITVPL